MNWGVRLLQIVHRIHFGALSNEYGTRSVTIAWGYELGGAVTTDRTPYSFWGTVK